jgi:hypothetical protein
VTRRDRRAGVFRIGRAAMGERLGGFVYGTVVVLAVIAAGARAYPGQPGYVAALVLVTTGVLWLAHVYAHGLAHSVSRDEHLSRAELRHIARHELSIVEAGVPSVVALLLGAAGVLEANTAVWIAIGLGLAVLAAQGFIFARVEGLGRLGTLGVVAGNLALGLLLVALKVLVGH